MGIIVQDFVVFHQTEQRPYFLALSGGLKEPSTIIRNVIPRTEIQINTSQRHLEIVCNQTDCKYICCSEGRKEAVQTDLYLPVDGRAGGDSLVLSLEPGRPPPPSSSLKLTGFPLEFEIFSTWNILTSNIPTGGGYLTL